MKFEDNLIIGFDYTELEDITCLAVARLSGEKVEVLRIFHGQEAEELYEKELVSTGKYEQLLLTAFRPDLVYGEEFEGGELND